MTDSELSLAVVRIMYPKYEWVEWGGVAVSDNDGMEFYYADKDCAWDMAVWLAVNATLSTQKSMPYLLRMDNAIFQLAMAIKKVGESNGH